MNQPAAGTGPIGQTRNPIMPLLISFVCVFYWYIANMSMLQELKNYLKKDEIVPWHIWIPYYNIYIMCIQVPKWIAEAKQKAGSQNAQPSGFILYFLLAPYALASDLNDVWNPRGQLPAGSPG